MKINPLPSLEILSEYFQIDPSSPSFISWKKGKSLKMKVGDPAGTIITKRYYRLRLSLNGENLQFMASRAVYALFHGTTDFNNFEVDHIDGNTKNNNPENLRLVDRSENNLNRKSKKNSKTGFKGVKVQGKKFGAYIVINRKQVYLGIFSTPEQAHLTYMSKFKEIYGYDSPL
jgi:hypothetical protein